MLCNGSIFQELKKKLRSEIYQLQVECDRLADEVDQWSDPRGSDFIIYTFKYFFHNL